MFIKYITANIDALKADFQKAKKQIQINHFPAPPFCSGAPFRTKIVRLTAAAISIKLIEEKFHAKILINSMTTQEQSIIALGSFFLCSFFIMVTAASRIKMPTAILIPLNAFAMMVSSRKLSKNIEIR